MKSPLTRCRPEKPTTLAERGSLHLCLGHALAPHQCTHRTAAGLPLPCRFQEAATHPFQESLSPLVLTSDLKLRTPDYLTLIWRLSLSTLPVILRFHPTGTATDASPSQAAWPWNQPGVLVRVFSGLTGIRKGSWRPRGLAAASAMVNKS